MALLRSFLFFPRKQVQKTVLLLQRLEPAHTSGRLQVLSLRFRLRHFSLRAVDRGEIVKSHGFCRPRLKLRLFEDGLKEGHLRLKVLQTTLATQRVSAVGGERLLRRGGFGLEEVAASGLPFREVQLAFRHGAEVEILPRISPFQS